MDVFVAVWWGFKLESQHLSNAVEHHQTFENIVHRGSWKLEPQLLPRYLPAPFKKTQTVFVKGDAFDWKAHGFQSNSKTEETKNC